MYLNIYRIGCLQPFFISFTAILKLPWFYLKYLMISQAIRVSDPGFYLLIIFPLFPFLQLPFQHSLEKTTHLLKSQSKEKKLEISRKENALHLLYRRGIEVQRDWTTLPTLHRDLRWWWEPNPPTYSHYRHILCFLRRDEP